MRINFLLILSTRISRVLIVLFVQGKPLIFFLFSCLYTKSSMHYTLGTRTLFPFYGLLLLLLLSHKIQGEDACSSASCHLQHSIDRLSRSAYSLTNLTSHAASFMVSCTILFHSLSNCRINSYLWHLWTWSFWNQVNESFNIFLFFFETIVSNLSLNVTLFFNLHFP